MLKRRDILSKGRNSTGFERKDRISQKESEEDEARSKRTCTEQVRATPQYLNGKEDIYLYFFSQT